MSNISLSFYGGTREVTGACYLLETRNQKPETRILVDCGMFQGCEDCDFRNHQKFPFDASKIDAVILTHAHVDHIGRLPKIYREGFRGPIYATPPTRDLAEVLLHDAMNFFGSTSSPQAKSGQGELWSESDLAGVLKLFQPIEYCEEIALKENLKFKLLEASHILGSAFVRVEIGSPSASPGTKVLVFSGDVGNAPSILLPARSSIPEAKFLVVESVYGNKRHKTSENRRLLLERAIEDIAARKGTLMIPVFATERTQEILYEINEMLQFKRVPSMPVFVDSPLAIKATAVFSKYPRYYREEVQKLHKEHPHLFEFKNLKMTESVQESKAINGVPPPKVILAGSGMSTGGRILHHEKRYLPDPNSILLITGFQAAGSLGRRLLDHSRSARIHNKEVKINAEIRVIDGYSAHADEEQLLAFVDEMRDNLEKVFVVQGEPDAALGFQQAIQDRLGVSAVAPIYGERFEL